MSGHQLPMPFPEADNDQQPVYPAPQTAIEEIFAEAFIALGGKFIFCENEREFLDHIHLLYENRGWQHLLCADERMYALFHEQGIDIVAPADPYQEDAEACITGCEMLAARTGSILFSSNQHLGRTAPVFYPVHIVFVYADQIVPDLDDAFTTLKKKYKDNLPSMINVNTGPSRTADIEKTLVVGVHGPAEVFCFFINAESGVFYK